MPISINGTGTITGISAGGLPDACITTDDIAGSAVTTAKLNDSSVTTAKLAQPMTLATAQNTTSGTAIDFTGIPSWVKKITMMLQGVSTNGVSSLIIRLGTSSGFASSGYLGSSASYSYTNGLPVDDMGNSSAVRHGYVQIMNITGNSWVSGSSVGRSDAAGAYATGGSVSLGSTLTQIRLTTFNGTDTFDAGSVNIMYEG